jgi:hypothetical protein
MKKYNFLALLLISIFIFSCSKENEISLPENAGKSAEQQNPSQNLAEAKLTVPEFNEKNSKKVPWDQLPSELRNATQLDNSKEPTKELAQKGQAQAQTAVVSYKYQVGPWGGVGGGAYYIWPTRSGSRIYAIAVRSGSLVDAITVWYLDSYGQLYRYGAGGTGGSYRISYFSADEYIYAAGGRRGQYLDHLYIWTNKKTLSYGGYGGTYFQYVTPSSYYQILGFFGGSGTLIDRIGFYVYSRW